MKIGILGTGDVGQSLGTGFIDKGHDVLMGSRKAGNEKATAWAKQAGPKATTGTFADAAKFGDVIVLATKWTGTENALKLAGFASFAGKVVIDVTNPLEFTRGMPRLVLGHTDSGGETIQRWLKGAKVVKAFNTVGHDDMVNPRFPGGPPDMFIAGDDPGAKQTVAEICRQFGWPVIDIGGLEGARELESLCMLWCFYGFKTDTWNHAFKLLRR